MLGEGLGRVRVAGEVIDKGLIMQALFTNRGTRVRKLLQQYRERAQ